MTATNIFAQSYYVKADGNDSLDGLSDVTAWKTISKVNSFSFSIGDDVYFKCGSRWIQERLNIDWSGTSANRAIIGAYYGSGTIGVSGIKPTIDGEYVFPTDQWTSLINIENQNYITVTNILVQNSKGRGINVKGSISGASYINIIGCDVNKTYQKGIGLEQKCSYSTIEGCSVTDTGRVGIETAGDWPSAIGPMRDCSYITIRGNTVFGNQGEGIGLYVRSDNCIVENNFVYENRRVNIYNELSRNNIIRNNLVYGTDASGSFTGIGFDDESQWGVAYTQNLEIYGNFIANCSVGLYLATSYSGSVFRNHKIYNNTIVDCLINIKSYDGPYENSEIKNNIFWCPSGACTQASFPDTGGEVVFDYNLWSSEPVANVKGPNDLPYSSPMLKRTTGWRTLEGKNVTISDFALQKGSPAIDTGTQMIGASYNELGNISNNILDTTINKLKQNEYGSGWEVGAAIFVEDGNNQLPSKPSPPSNLKIGLN
jgi:parallel beta-helix repeat protein